MLAEVNKKENNMITSSLEEYLKTIYVLKKQGEEIRVTTIAEKMNCSKPSVNKAINNLKAKCLVNYEVYGEIELTPEGEQLSKKILEAYDIAYIFLTEILGVQKGEAEEEAIKIKSVLKDNTLNALTKYVHNLLGIYNLDCNYDINKEECRNCRRKVLRKKEV